MDTQNLDPTSAPKSSAITYKIDPAAAAADPFLSILDATTRREPLPPVDDAQSEDDATAAAQPEEPAGDPEQPAAVPAPAQLLVLAGRGDQAPATVRAPAAADPAKQANTPAAAAAKPEAATKTDPAAVATSKPDAAAKAATPQATVAHRPADRGPGPDADIQVSHDTVRARPATANTATAAAVVQDEQALPPDLRAERYAALRAGQADAAAPVRLAERGGRFVEPAVPNPATGQSAGRVAEPAPLRIATAEPAVILQQPNPPTPTVTPIAGLAGQPGQAVFAAADPTPGVASLTGTGGAGANDAARVAAATRGQPAVTARPAEQIAVQIKNGIKAGADKIHIRLQPAALGRVEVNLEVGHDQRVQAVVTVEKVETLEILERDARSLHRMLEAAGYRTDNDSLAFRHDARDGDNPRPGHTPDTIADPERSADATDDGDAPERVSRHDGLLDVQV